MIKVLFFARLREQLDTEVLELESTVGLTNIAAIEQFMKIAISSEQQGEDRWLIRV